MALVARKMTRLLVVALIVSAITFALLNALPGDLAYVVGGEEASAEDIQAIRRELSLDNSVGERYFRWLVRIVKGDLGNSYINYEPVANAILNRLPVTVELIVVSQILALLLALPAGIACAHTTRSLLDRGITTTAFATLSTPSFIMALVLIFCFALKLDCLPATGFVPLSEGLGGNLRSIL